MVCEPGEAAMPARPPRRDELTFRANLRDTRHGWLRLTPAYSIHLVGELLARSGRAPGPVLDPFCGTGTTALVCAERGIEAATCDINPFLLWLTAAKARPYEDATLRVFRRAARGVAQAIGARGDGCWVPAIHRIERWWDEPTRAALGRALAFIRREQPALGGAASDLLLVAFCRAMIDSAQVSFAHQSVSFRKPPTAERGGASDGPASPVPTARQQRLALEAAWRSAVDQVALGAASPIVRPPTTLLVDARALGSALAAGCVRTVITSPPYPNRMSYVRELRPYMYWLGYLTDSRQAGELDWQAIGGTWGCATSRVGRWQPPAGSDVPARGFPQLVAAIGAHSPLLGSYVHKYFHDMVEHCRAIHRALRPGGAVHYVVGNSKFYDVLVPTEQLLAELLGSAGFEAAQVETLRKRTSKKELFEFLVSARKAR